MSFIEFLLYDNKQSVDELLKREQATTPEFEAAKEAYAAVMAAIAALEKQKADLQAEAEGTGVKANAAKAQLAQLLAADNLELNRLVTHAEEGLKKAKKTVGAAPGGVWWFNRQLDEAKKYKPGKKSGSSTSPSPSVAPVSTPTKATPKATATPTTATPPTSSAQAASAASSLRREREAAFQHIHSQFLDAKDPKSLLALIDDRIIRQKLQDLATPIQTEKPKPAALTPLTTTTSTATTPEGPASPKSPVSPTSPTKKCLGGCGFRGRDKLEGFCDLCYRKKIGLS